MRSFIRSFTLTFFLTMIFLITVCLFIVVFYSAERSGFSSGEFFLTDFDEGVFSLTVFGKSSSVDFSPVLKVFDNSDKFAVILSPTAELVIRFFCSLFLGETANV